MDQGGHSGDPPLLDEAFGLPEASEIVAEGQTTSAGDRSLKPPTKLIPLEGFSSKRAEVRALWSGRSELSTIVNLSIQSGSRGNPHDLRARFLSEVDPQCVIIFKGFKGTLMIEKRGRSQRSLPHPRGSRRTK